jgi:hypothetical protein
MKQGIFVVKFANGTVSYLNEVQLIAAGISPLASNVRWASIRAAELHLRGEL